MRVHRKLLTSRFLQPVTNGFQLYLEPGVLDFKPSVGILQTDFKVLDPLAAREQLALGDARLFLEDRVLIDELKKRA